MGDHDVYGKAVMRRAAESAFCDYGPAVQVTYGTTRGGATIDGVVEQLDFCGSRIPGTKANPWRCP